ncbi:MAG: transcriptional repressor [Planctomycetales bacterium]
MMNSFSLGEVKVSLTPAERFEEFLQSKGKRRSKQKTALVETIFAQHEHFDAKELMDRMRESDDSDETPSHATVYRLLCELEEAGLLRKMELNGRAVYEHDYGYPQHDHMYCERCRKLIEFQSEEIKKITDAVAGEHQFRATGRRLIVYGICNDCAQPRKGRNRPHDKI